jgi:hypothetical protein
MEHIVFLDSRAQELEKLFEGKKTMLVRGAKGRRIPYGKVSCGERLYFIPDDGKSIIRASAIVRKVIHSSQLTREESACLIIENQHNLQLSKGQILQWAGKPFLVLVEIEDLVKVDPVRFRKDIASTAGDWLPIEKLQPYLQPRMRTMC